MVIGSVYMYAGNTAPSGFLLCDGSAVSRATYSTLFNEIGTTYGVGDGAATFNLPDLSGRVAIGISSTHLLGGIGGEETHALLSAEMPEHSHTVPSHGHTNTIKATTPSLSHSITQPAFTYTAPNGTLGGASSGSYSGNRAGTNTSTATIATNMAVSNHSAASCTKTGGVTDCNAFDTQATGSGDAHSNMQPFLTMNYIIYTGV